MGRVIQFPNRSRPARLSASQKGQGASVTRADVDDADKIAAALNGLMRVIDDFRRTTPAPWIEFEDLAIPLAGDVTLPHHLGGRVRWWVTDWQGVGPPQLSRAASSTSDVLVLTSSATGTATIRVEALS